MGAADRSEYISPAAAAIASTPGPWHRCSRRTHRRPHRRVDQPHDVAEFLAGQRLPYALSVRVDRARERRGRDGTLFRVRSGRKSTSSLSLCRRLYDLV